MTDDDEKVIITPDLNLLSEHIGLDPAKFAHEMDAAQEAEFCLTLELDIPALAAIAGAMRASLVYGKTSPELVEILQETLALIVSGVRPTYPSISKMLANTAIPLKAMDPAKRERLESKGWKVGDAEDFLAD